MPRYQLQIREPGRPPRIVPLRNAMIVGRSRRADIPIEDEEVGREQFRIVFADGSLVLEGIGQTNKTFVEGAAVGPGQRVAVRTGTPIHVGRTTFVVQPADLPTPAASNQVDATMVAPRPRLPSPAPAPDARQSRSQPPPEPAPAPKPPSPADAIAEQERTGDGISPAKAGDVGVTIPPQAYRPGGPKAPTDDDGRTMPLAPGGPRGSAKPEGQAPDENTLQPQDYRPGGARKPQPGDEASDDRTVPLKPGSPRSERPAAPASPASPTDSAEPNLTLPPSAGYRPGQSQPKSRPETPPSPPAAPQQPQQQQQQQSPPSSPKVGPPPPLAKTVEPIPAAQVRVPAAPRSPEPPTGDRQMTVVLPGQLPPEAASKGLPPAELESRLHLSLPHVFAKGDGVRRRQRLIKLRNLVGRGINVDVLLPSESISEEHAEIVFDGTAWMLRDLGSTNGTTVDGQSLKGASAPLRRHSLLGFGNVRAIFLCSDPKAPLAHKKLDIRAVRTLVATGRIGRAIADQALQMARTDGTLSLPEILLTETSLEPQDWHLAVQQAARRRGLFGWLFGRFRRR